MCNTASLINFVSGSLGNETFGWLMYNCILGKPYLITSYPTANGVELRMIVGEK